MGYPRLIVYLANDGILQDWDDFYLLEMSGLLQLVSLGTPIKYEEILGNSWGLEDGQNEGRKMIRGHSAAQCDCEESPAVEDLREGYYTLR